DLPASPQPPLSADRKDSAPRTSSSVTTTARHCVLVCRQLSDVIATRLILIGAKPVADCHRHRSRQRRVTGNVVDPLPLIVPLNGGFCWPLDAVPYRTVPVMTPLLSVPVNPKVFVTVTAARAWLV